MKTDDLPKEPPVDRDARQLPLAVTLTGDAPPSSHAAAIASIEELPTIDPAAYAMIGEHGRGGLGRVLAAEDLRLGRVVAVKELIHESAESARRFVREVRMTARLQHPAIVPVYEAGRWPRGKMFYAMKLVQGRSLKELIEDKKTLGPDPLS